jgi:ABC-type Fe3+-hydroxamate transport system substrate-binding protein
MTIVIINVVVTVTETGVTVAAVDATYTRTIARAVESTVCVNDNAIQITVCTGHTAGINICIDIDIGVGVGVGVGVGKIGGDDIGIAATDSLKYSLTVGIDSFAIKQTMV